MSKQSFFPTLRTALRAGVSVAALVCASTSFAQNQTPPGPPPVIPSPAPVTTENPDGSKTTVTRTIDNTGAPTTSVGTTKTFGRKKKSADKDDKVVQSKDTKKEAKKEQKAEALIGADSRLPDKQLYDKAQTAIKKGHFDVARLDLQTMLNTYPDSQYQMRAKLAIADSWFKEGGTAALTQAETEYADFRVFFPNVPEAAEAQMRIGDIYFKQMDRPDRDYQKSLHAEEEYRRMLTDYPDSTLVPQARQRLREVQEVLGSREADIASYYATRENWAAVIARYQTVVDTYPLYSHMDDVLIGLGDAYEAQARYVRTLTLPEAGKAQLEKLYDTQAADAYRKVVAEHSAAPHVEDARDRLAAMSLPIPDPTPEQAAASVALENSRGQYTISKRAMTIFMHTPDTVPAAGVGEPTLTDPRATVAPTIVKRVNADFAAAFSPPAPGAARPAVAPTAATPAADASAPATSAVPARPLALEDVGAESGSGAGANLTAAPVRRTSTGTTTGTGNGINVEILTPGANGTTVPAPADGNFIKPVGPKNADALPAVEKAGAAPDRPNEITSPTPAAQTLPANGKAPKPAFDKSEESSSKHPRKKGLKKIVAPL